MKTQLTKPARSKARYTDEYRTGGVSELRACESTQCSQGSGGAVDLIGAFIVTILIWLTSR